METNDTFMNIEMVRFTCSHEFNLWPSMKLYKW
jgi:hypothetical protein